MVDDLQSSEETAFVSEEVEKVILSAVEQHLKDKIYDAKRVPGWIDAICEDCVQGLTDFRKPFKYVVTALIMQKTELECTQRFRATGIP